MLTYQTILFDLDGTLTDPKPGITKSIQYALAHLHIPIHDLETLTPFIGPPLSESFQRYYDLSPEQTQEAIRYYREYFADTGLYENAVYPEIPALLSALQRAGKRLAVATSKPTIFAERILAHFQLNQYFDIVAGSEFDGTNSEKADVIATVLRKLPGSTAQTTVMIGDRKHDIVGAQKNDLHSIAVAYGYGTLEELQLAAPTYFAATVSELVALFFH
ncbi:MAG TPA: HAD family hydrolase [Ktedonobacteraceae bacterium]|jgi:phosphoglycolate phosphatase|nr:HAD family hydrolase [Ktedonobacteraceae bacterium]